MARLRADEAEQARRAEAEQREAADAERNRALTAEQAAREEGAKSKKSEAETGAVLEFFRNKVLAAARPQGQEGGLGKDVTLRAAVDGALAGIGKDFADQPLVEAAIRDTLGESYHYLGEQALAIKEFERARSSCAERFSAPIIPTRSIRWATSLTATRTRAVSSRRSPCTSKR